jgi:hypothetical protein
MDFGFRSQPVMELIADPARQNALLVKFVCPSADLLFAQYPLIDCGADCHELRISGYD